jgi:hypothetical protein
LTRISSFFEKSGPPAPVLRVNPLFLRLGSAQQVANQPRLDRLGTGFFIARQRSSDLGNPSHIRHKSDPMPIQMV